MHRIIQEHPLVIRKDIWKPLQIFTAIFSLLFVLKANGEKPKDEWLDFPGVDEGIRGMAFIENVVASGKSDAKWTEFQDLIKNE
jgi:hypothetical protein